MSKADKIKELKEQIEQLQKQIQELEKFRVIDLINMKYNKEKMPEHIYINRMYFDYDYDIKTYRDENGNWMAIDFDDNTLNMIVKIIKD